MSAPPIAPASAQPIGDSIHDGPMPMFAQPSATFSIAGAPTRPATKFAPNPHREQVVGRRAEREELKPRHENAGDGRREQEHDAEGEGRHRRGAAERKRPPAQRTRAQPGEHDDERLQRRTRDTGSTSGASPAPNATSNRPRAR